MVQGVNNIVEYSANLVEGARRAYAKKWSFLGIFALVFVVSVSTLAELDLLPNALSTGVTNNASVVAKGLSKSSLNVATSTTTTFAPAEIPVRVSIASIGVKATVANPDTTNAETLDQYLLRGAVRYPTSVKLGENGNVVLFGHSSYLPIVGNQAYKTFNEIQKLKKGDVVTVSSSGTAYTYEVRTVAKESASDNSAISLSVGGKVLTLVTCNSFGVKSDRFVVTADFVESHPQGA